MIDDMTEVTQEDRDRWNARLRGYQDEIDRLRAEVVERRQSLHDERNRSNARLLELQADVENLRAAIREHRDQRGDDRCWEDDVRLYAVLGEGDVPPEQSALPARCDFLASCERYWAQRQAPDARGSFPLPQGMTIAQLTQEVERLKRERRSDMNVILSYVELHREEWTDNPMTSGNECMCRCCQSARQYVRTILAGLDPEPAQAERPLPPEVVEIDYTNWQGKRSTRRIIPGAFRWGSNEWHPTPQWLLDAYDCEKQAERTFALVGIWSCRPASSPGPDFAPGRKTEEGDTP